MWSRSIFWLSSCLLLAVVWSGPVLAAEDSVTIVYPRPNQVLGASDSSFVLGSVPKKLLETHRDLIVRINGFPFPVHRDGGFIGFVPLAPDTFLFSITVHVKPPEGSRRHTPSVARGSVQVIVPSAPQTPGKDTLRIYGDFQAPAGDLALSEGDLLTVSFLGTPGCKAWFAIQDVVDSVAMSEVPPRLGAYWGDAVFGGATTLDSILPGGVYSGYYQIPGSARADTVRITYFVASDSIRAVDALQRLRQKRPVVWDTSGYRVTMNSQEFPFTVRIVDSLATIRHGLMKGYLASAQFRGTEMLAVGAMADWYKVRLSETQYGWVNGAQVERLPFGLQPPRSEIRSIRQHTFDDSTVIRFPVEGLHPFRTWEEDRRTIRVQLFGVLSNTDWIRYAAGDTLVDFIRWSQPERDLFEITITLRSAIWGYECGYGDGNFCIKIVRPPSDLGSLRGKRIVIDPGHSSDPGAIGPTGLVEAEANLTIALRVREELTKRGADVVMTRPDMRHVPLADRPVIAKQNGAELFVSIHNNALPDGVNPFQDFGTGTFYYHPHSIDLARAIQHQMLIQTGLPDYGVYHGNLAVIRPTLYPAVLVECAFMMLPDQEALIKTDKFQKQVATAVADGIERFCKEWSNGR